jgi:hypothetical protein
MVVETGESIPQLLHTAASLRRAKRMQTEFMLRWALEKRAKMIAENDDSNPITDVRNCDWAARFKEFESNDPGETRARDPDMDD